MSEDNPEQNHTADGAEEPGGKGNGPPAKCCMALRQCLHSCTRPCTTRYNPLPHEPSIPQMISYSLRCPPHGKLAKYLMFVLMFGVSWAVLISLTGPQGLPGGNFFSLVILFFFCVIGGYLVTFIRLPPLLGMLIVGCLLRNVPKIDIVGNNLDSGWSSALRQIALTVILIRAGLGLDPAALRKLSFAVVRLAFSPCLMECVAEAVAAHFLLGLPWIWCFMLGFVLAAVSPAVVVPSLLNLSDRGYGINKGIPTLVIAAASIDDVLAITGFGVCLGIAFSEGDLALSILKGPLEAIVGVLYGILGGLIIWYIPNRASRHVILYRTFLLFGLGLMSTFGSSKMEFPGAGPLGCLTLAFVAGFRWKKEDWSSNGGKEPMTQIVAILWMIFQPLLFGLIGSAVDISKIDAGSVGKGIGVLGIGMVIRLIVSFFSVFGTDLNLKERLFIPFAWLPKATVQAAIGALAMDKAMEMGDSEGVAYGKEILTLAVLSIVITAPIGAAIIAITGPILLHHTEREQSLEYVAEEVEEGTDNEEKGTLLQDQTDIV
ncbi:SL9B2-like protein [Mya arenaria]|uniref:SL9B2-like protein n=1 Tax=Mya arenaria TaxID=6604 RepID=A0ABY7FHR8_MYAAR|nr:sodium/hydrogen exchanger 9B2-like [Mya arenaria]XP_052773687.1 sodium/hydrogen exchanger 9B2-like [Mya arenaria]XP_052773688.1 sodium/hydrogen exchanger 9B2-like [Mya arenaria]XP_052773689.1 sodium/hydrogen exchanger 9B2-like [Mya arenaria]XP_052773690.1 sodium/hydrogen exchanger 9B2-like [Mya arenaria]XP_052785262.1 sodium/hydrogen exchanger 9B2-like [Mya arenaria]XP_052785269.1 sodium/hydrogen exchanger 9B2-like [Mya arenaria]XP_052785280.1 sodium/hydrogen exchanger 9B2-like [Mya arena